MDNEIKNEIDDAVKKAKADNEIALEELTYDVYSNPLENIIRGIDPWSPLQHKRFGPAVNLK